MRLTICLLCIAVTGCNTPLDKAQHKAITSWGTANKSFEAAIEIYTSNLNKIMVSHFENERKRIKEEFDTWLDNQTVGGEMVLTDDKNIPLIPHQPMLLEDLKEALLVMDTAFSAIEADEVNWEKYHSTMVSAIENFRRLNSLNLENADSVNEARESAQYLLDTSLSAIAGAAAGLTVVP